MQTIETLADVHRDIDKLCEADPRLRPVRERVELWGRSIELRRTTPTFASLAAIVTGQQVSTASAAAIFGRLSALLDPLTPAAVLGADRALFRQAGLSAAKVRTLLAAAEAVERGGLVLDAAARLPAAEAIARLTAVPGIGPWTAEIFLLFAAGHPDVFPAGDVALQTAVGHALGLAPRPGAKALAAIARDWSPRRGAAARLFWAYYRTIRGREGAPVAPSVPSS